MKQCETLLFLFRQPKGSFAEINSLNTPQTNKKIGITRVNEVHNNDAREDLTHPDEGRDGKFMLHQNIHDMHILESWGFSPMHYCWEATHIWRLNATAVHLSWCSPEVQPAWAEPQKQSMNKKVTREASVRMGDFLIFLPGSASAKHPLFLSSISISA